MQKAKYLKMRKLNDKKRSINVAEQYIQKELAQKYQKARDEIKAEMKTVLAAMAEGEGVTLTEMKKRIRSLDFKDINFEEMAKEASQKAKELAALTDIVPKEVLDKLIKEQEANAKLLNAYAKRGYMTRMELAQIHLQNAILALKQGEHTDLFRLLQKEYKDGFFRGVFHMQNSMGVGFDFVKPSADAVRRVLMRDFGSKNFSERIWSGQKRLGRKIQDALSVGLIRGETPQKITKRLLKRVDVSFSDARRLVRTEVARIHEESSIASYESMEVERFEFLATLDRKTSDICQEQDGKVYETKKAEVGINMPPMHPNCRSTTVPYFKDDDGERFARNADGRGYMVPQGMMYKQWYDNLEETEKGKMHLRNEMDKNRRQDKAQYLKYKEVLENDAGSFKEFTVMKYNAPNQFKNLQKMYYNRKYINQFKAKIKAGTVNTTIQKNKQAEHTQGSKAFLNRFKQAWATQNTQRAITPHSFLFKDVDAGQLVKRYSGTGDFDYNGQSVVYEYITTDKEIGRYFDTGRKKYVKTKRICILYNNKGVHVYPVKERRESQ